MVVEGWGANLKRQAVSLLPLLSGLVLVLVTATPLYLGHVGDVAPRLGVTAVIFWTAYRPDLFGYASAFLLGLVADLMTGLPLGLTALVLVMVRYGVVTRRRYFLRKAFHIVWAEYALVVMAAVVVHWLLAALYLWSYPGLLVYVFQVLLTVALFPAVYWILTRFQDLVSVAAREAAGSG